MAMLAVAWLLAMAAHAAEPIRISTQKMDLIMQVNGQGRLVQSYLGKRLLHDSDLGWLKEGREFAIDAESSKKKHEAFGKYKGRINNWLSKRGYNLTKEREQWAKRVKARGGTL